MRERRAENQSPQTELYWYKRIPRDEVDEQVLAYADRAAKFFAEDLKVPVPTIQWFLPERWERAEREQEDQRVRSSYFTVPKMMNGHTDFSFQNGIDILASLDEVQLIRAIAHEMRHVRQEHDHGSQWRKDNFAGQAEEEALEYESEATQRYPDYVALVEPKDSFDREFREALKLPEERPDGIGESDEK